MRKLKPKPIKLFPTNEYAKQIDDDFSESENQIAVITAEGRSWRGKLLRV
jgi:hypothetical protein